MLPNISQKLPCCEFTFYLWINTEQIDIFINLHFLNQNQIYQGFYFLAIEIRCTEKLSRYRIPKSVHWIIKKYILQYTVELVEKETSSRKTKCESSPTHIGEQIVHLSWDAGFSLVV